MSGLFPVLPISVSPAVAAPGAVTNLEQVSNDIRLPSRSALPQQREIGRSVSVERVLSNPLARTAKAGALVTLSPVARALSVLLDLPSSAPPRIVGLQALWPMRQPLTTPLLAQTLANTVDKSGLFYESHLQQFAVGTRSLVQLLQEPQASLPVVARTGTDILTSDEVTPLASLLGLSLKNRSTLMQSDDSAARPEMEGNFIKALAGSSLDSVRDSALSFAGVHVDAAALVRQQLEFLAVPVFRWSGEAWPSVPMDWEIHQESDESKSFSPSEASQFGWRTRVVLCLPELKDIEVRLSLVGSSVQIVLAASQNGTVALMTDQRSDLAARFAELGLQMKGMNVGKLVSRPTSSDEAEEQ